MIFKFGDMALKEIESEKGRTYEQELTVHFFAAFLNQIVAALWPNINVAGSQMTKDIADPMFKTMLPGPLSSLHFTKVDLGNVPMTFSNVVVTKTETNGIKLDMNVDWKGKCDIELAGSHIPTLVRLASRSYHLEAASADVTVRVSKVLNSLADSRSIYVL